VGRGPGEEVLSRPKGGLESTIRWYADNSLEMSKVIVSFDIKIKKKTPHPPELVALFFLSLTFLHLNLSNILIFLILYKQLFPKI